MSGGILEAPGALDIFWELPSAADSTDFATHCGLLTRGLPVRLFGAVYLSAGSISRTQSPRPERRGLYRADQVAAVLFSRQDPVVSLEHD